MHVKSTFDTVYCVIGLLLKPKCSTAKGKRVPLIFN